MRTIEADNAPDNLRDMEWIARGEQVAVREMSGGVSNRVLYVTRSADAGEDFVVKQARPRLRVPDPWFCPVDRIWREVEVLRICEQLLARDRAGAALDPDKAAEVLATTPRILHEDRENFVFAMTAAPREHRVWKHDLLAGTIDSCIARACGALLGRLHAASWRDCDVAARLDDCTIFDQLRLDPYYRTLARAWPDCAGEFQRLIDGALSHRCALVHADFSPKNLLVYDGGMMMVDFETGHYGDPAFDLGFFLSHLVLKAIYHRHTETGAEPLLRLTLEFWSEYRRRLDPVVATVAAGLEYRRIVKRAAAHFAGCLWARIDGKSRVEYLNDDTSRELGRTIARAVFNVQPRDWDDVLAICRGVLNAPSPPVQR